MANLLDLFSGTPQPTPIQNTGLQMAEEDNFGDPRTISGRIQEWLGAKPSSQGGMVQDILSKRFQPQEDNSLPSFLQQRPSLDDVSQGAVQTFFGGGKPVSGQNVSDERMKGTLDKLSTLTRAQYLSKGGGSGSVFAQTMEAINNDPELAGLPMRDKIRMAQNKLGTNLTMGANGHVSDMAGAAQGLGNLAYGEKSGGERGQKEVDLELNPLIVRGEADQRNASDIAAAAPKAAASERGAAEGKQQTNLPVLEQNTTYSQELLKKLVNHPGLPYAVGMGSLAPTVPGTPQADFRALRDQVNSVAFLQAFSALRGSGAISNAEGDKATTAITRLNVPNQSPEAFKQAANELFNILEVGRQRARQEAQGNFNQTFSPDQFNQNNPGMNLPVKGNGNYKNDLGVSNDQARQAPDGNFYIPDPNRPGKYLMVRP